MKTRTLFILVVGLLIRGSISVVGETLTLSSSSFAVIRDSVGANATDQRVLAKFDLPGGLQGMTIDLAEIRYKTSQVNELSDGYQLAVMPVTVTWTSNSVTWSNSWTENGANVDLQKVRAGFVKPTVSREGTLNVTSLVKAWVGGTMANNGIIVFPASTKNKDFNLDNVAGNDKLQLVIYYTKD